MDQVIIHFIYLFIIFYLFLILILLYCHPTLHSIIGRHAFVGMGFTERNDAFDFNTTILDHLKYVSIKYVLFTHIYKRKLYFNETTK